MASVAFNFQPFYRPTVFPASLHLSGHQSHARHQDNQQGGFEKCEAQVETRGAINKVIQVKKLMFRHGLIDSWSQYLLFFLIIIQQSSSSRTASLSTCSSFSSSSASSTYLPSLLWASTTSWSFGVKSKACLHLWGCFIDSVDRLTWSNWDPIVSNRPLRSRSLQEGWLVQASRCIMHTAYYLGISFGQRVCGCLVYASLTLSLSPFEGDSDHEDLGPSKHLQALRVLPRSSKLALQCIEPWRYWVVQQQYVNSRLLGELQIILGVVVACPVCLFSC